MARRRAAAASAAEKQAALDAAHTLLSLRYAASPLPPPPPLLTKLAPGDADQLRQELARSDAEQLELCTRLLAEATERVRQLGAAADAAAVATTEARGAYSVQLQLMNLDAARQTESALRTSKLYIEHLITARSVFK